MKRILAILIALFVIVGIGSTVSVSFKNVVNPNLIVNTSQIQLCGPDEDGDGGETQV